MRKDVINKSATLGSTSDLTVYAPIMEGFIGSLDAVSYKTRVKRVLNTLHLGRRSSHEYDLFRAMSDAVERVGRIHSIRIAILEREGYLERGAAQSRGGFRRGRVFGG